MCALLHAASNRGTLGRFASDCQRQVIRTRAGSFFWSAYVQKTSPNGFVPLFIYTRVLLMAARRSNGIDNYSAVISSQDRVSAAAALMNFSTLCSTRRRATHAGRKKCNLGCSVNKKTNNWFLCSAASYVCCEGCIETEWRGVGMGCGWITYIYGIVHTL